MKMGWRKEKVQVLPACTVGDHRCKDFSYIPVYNSERKWAGLGAFQPDIEYMGCLFQGNVLVV
jgi:hypothetical protein